MSTVWMVRAGEGSRLFDDFSKGYVAVGYNEMGDMSSVPDIESIRKRYSEAYPDAKKGAVANQVSMFHKFRSVVEVGDRVVTYDAKGRKYLFGTITGEHVYKPDLVGDYPNIREVTWDGKVERDDLRVASRNSLGSTLTLFSINEDVWNDILAAASGEPSGPATDEEARDDFEQIRQETISRAHELIKDKILSLSDSDLERLAAAILRSLGYQTRVSPPGPDRGVDVFASPDGLGLEEPRIKVEVKHRPRTSMGPSDIRSFLGVLRAGDKGIYVSTGGFTKEAKYEAERSTVPATLLDLDDLATLIVTHYESFDLEGSALIPLVRIYWPAE